MEKIVIDLHDKKEYMYRTGEIKLGKGTLGTVYRGKPVDGSGLDVAVKVPLPNLVGDVWDRFWEEYIVMAGLWEKGNFVAWVHEGQEKNTGQKVMIMELVEQEKSLSHALSLNSGLERERIALQAAVQYAKLLEALHSLGYTCTDRDTPDLHWLGEEKNGRLIVLDWNVVNKVEKKEGAPVSKDNMLDQNDVEKEVSDLVSKDIYLFGSLWYRLLTEKYPQPGLTELNDEKWCDGEITYGSRRLLVKALHSRPKARFQDASLLRVKLEERLKRLVSSVDDLASDGKERLDLVNSIEHRINESLSVSTLDRIELTEFPLPDLENEWLALDYLDLAVHKGRRDLEDELTKCLDLVRKQHSRLLEHMRLAFNLSAFERANKLFDWAMQIYEQSQNEYLRLKVNRWQFLVQIGELAAEANLYQSWFLQKRDDLSKWVEAIQENDLHEQDWSARKEEVGALIKDPNVQNNPSLLQLLLFLEKECEVREKLNHVQKSQEGGKYQEALDTLNEANNDLTDLENEEFQEVIRATWPRNFTEWRDELAKRLKFKMRWETWEHETDASKVISPLYLDYLLHGGRLDDLRRLFEDENKYQEKAEWLKKLAELFRQTVLSEINPLNWPSVVQIAHDLEANNHVPGVVKEKAKEQRNRVFDEAEKLYSEGNIDIAKDLYSSLSSDTQRKLFMAKSSQSDLQDDLAAKSSKRLKEIRGRQEILDRIRELKEQEDFNEAMGLAAEHNIRDIDLIRIFDNSLLDEQKKLEKGIENLTKKRSELDHQMIKVSENKDVYSKALGTLQTDLNRIITFTTLLQADEAVKTLNRDKVEKLLNKIDLESLERSEQEWFHTLEADKNMLKSLPSSTYSEAKNIRDSIQEFQPLDLLLRNTINNLIDQYPDSRLPYYWLHQDYLLQAPSDPSRLAGYKLNQMLKEVDQVTSRPLDTKRGKSSADEGYVWNTFRKLHEAILSASPMVLSLPVDKEGVTYAERLENALDSMVDYLINTEKQSRGRLPPDRGQEWEEYRTSNKAILSSYKYRVQSSTDTSG